MPNQPRYSKGQRIGGRFLVYRALMGGMGEVYLCLDEQNNNPYALKTFQAGSPGLRDIFKKEVAHWIALEKHPNIVRCFFMNTIDNVPFMVLEWIASEEGKGADLRSWLRYGPLPLALALRFTIDICRGLRHAGENVPGIVHRDLKPANVLVNQNRQAKITDFGLALVAQQAKLELHNPADHNALGRSTYVGGIVGTPAYMSPEQWRGELNLDFRTDLYGVGCILYEMLTGRWLYEAHTMDELRAQHLHAPIPQLNGGFPPEMQRILEGCLAKKREDRFGRLDLLLVELGKLYEAQMGEPYPKAQTEEMTAADFNNRGVTYFNLGQKERAIAEYSRAIELDPTDALVYCNRGSCYRALEEDERAVADLDRAIDLAPNFAPAYASRGASYGAMGQHQQALADCNRAIELDPNYASAYITRANRYLDWGEYKRKRSFYKGGKRYKPEDEHERALADYDRAIQLDPTNALAYYNRGKHYRDLKEYQRALADFERVIQLEPENALAYNYRGISYSALGQHERALADFDHAMQLDPNLARAYLNKGAALAKIGQRDEALKYGEKAMSLGALGASQFVSVLRGEYRPGRRRPWRLW